ncbi:hypothetical protein J2Z31_001813 [Sinorhizobium kostiense]|uniref:DUF4236 domain-containing protein n=1 Tax=Sinorhizobium kostiense TaxID=76747 RepID=A0ABS4QXF2_9HYPH|nr:hypothetical protein [Sinorhizobium kostiense]MBP2235321.1 hypothetical protein [Sinorhizobium kostiense]
MGFRFRKTVKFGPFRTTLTHRGITSGIGTGGISYSKTARFSGSRKRSPTTDEGQPAASQGNPVVGFIVLAVIGFAIFQILT